jgi:hypothetical protein
MKSSPWLYLAAALVMAGCQSNGMSTTGPSPRPNPSSLTDGAFGDVVSIDVAGRRLDVEAGTVIGFLVPVPDSAVITGQASSFGNIRDLYQTGFLVHVTGKTWKNSGMLATLDVQTSGPFPTSIEQSYGALQTLQTGIPAFVSGKSALVIPPDAVIAPSSPVPSLDALPSLFADGQWVCVTADTYKVSVISWRAIRYSLQPVARNASCPR